MGDELRDHGLEPLVAWGVSQGLVLTAPLRAEPLGRGRSNLTFRVTDGGERQVVVRRPPEGPLLPTAHDVLREARIMGALHPTAVPVPAVLAMCADPAVIGAPFAVFELVDGSAIIDSASAVQASPEVRGACGPSLLDALAALHALAPRDVGLDDLVRPGNYVERQLRRWSQQWDASGGDDPVMTGVQRRLVERLPRQQAVSLVHGDPKLDNCIVGAGGDVLALVDWELATIGDPLADLGACLAYWAQPDDVVVALQDPPSRIAGFATREELVARYAQGSNLDLSELPTYVAFAYWRIACIVQGVVARMTDRGDDGRDPFVAQAARLAALASQTLHTSGT